MNYTMLPILSEHTPAGSNAMMLAHYGQQVRSGKFHRYIELSVLLVNVGPKIFKKCVRYLFEIYLSRFDFGPRENLRKYGQYYPPEWHPENVTVPLALDWGPNDWFTADKVRKNASERG